MASFVAPAKSGTSGAAWIVLGFLAIAGALPLEEAQSYWLTIGVDLAIAAVGLDLLAGYAGLPSFGQFGLLACAAYLATALRTQVHIDGVFVLPLTLAGAGILSAALAVPMVRLRMWGIAAASFFFGYLVELSAAGTAFEKYTGSDVGRTVPPLQIGGWLQSWGHYGVYYVSLFFLVVAVGVALNVANSEWGRVARVAKHSEMVAASLGISTWGVRVAIFTLAGVFAGLAGYLYAPLVGIIIPESFTPIQSVNLFAMVAIGGIGSVAGPLLGALFYVALSLLLQRSGTLHEIIFATALLLTLVFLPRGVYGVLEDIVGFLRAKRQNSLELKPALPAELGTPAAPSLLEPKVTAPQRAPTKTGSTKQKPLPGQGVLLRIDDISVRFGEIQALDRVSVAIERGIVHAIIGPNGAGKTTLLNCLSGLQRVSAGRILLDGAVLSGAGSRSVRRAGVSRTFQNPSVVPDLSALENVELAFHVDRGRGEYLAELIGFHRWLQRTRMRRAIARAALVRVGIPEERHNVVGSALSLAEQKLTDIARAIAAQSRLLVLDEPSAGLRTEEIDRIAAVIRQLQDEGGMTIILVSHHIGFVTALADRVTVMTEGSVLAEGSPNDVLSHPAVLEAFLGTPVAEGNSHASS